MIINLNNLLATLYVVGCDVCNYVSGDMSHGYAPLKCLQLNKGLSKNLGQHHNFTI